MNNKNVINILYTPDNNTYKMALVSIQSVIENNKHNQLAFYYSSAMFPIITLIF